jgi:hypothetical protein
MVAIEFAAYTVPDDLRRSPSSGSPMTPSTLIVVRAAACVLSMALASDTTVAQTEPGKQQPDAGLFVNPRLLPPPSRDPVPVLNAPAPVPTFDGSKPVYALASAIGGQINYSAAAESVGSHIDRTVRRTLPVPDASVDATVLRGLDRVIAKRFPNSDRLYMRLNPAQLDGVPAPDRDRVAFDRLTAEIQRWPERQQWERIVLVTPHYRAFESSGLGSKLHGVGMYVQNLNNNSEYDTIEPDGTPGAKQRNRYVALYYVATVYILDAKSLRVLSSEPWTFDEKIHDSNAAGNDVARAIDVDKLAARLETFVQNAAETAVARTLGGRIEAGEIKTIPAPK